MRICSIRGKIFYDQEINREDDIAGNQKSQKYPVCSTFIPAASVGLIDKKITGTIVKLKK